MNTTPETPAKDPVAEGIKDNLREQLSRIRCYLPCPEPHNPDEPCPVCDAGKLVLAAIGKLKEI